MKLLAMNDSDLVALTEVTDDDVAILFCLGCEREMEFSLDDPRTDLGTYTVEIWRKPTDKNHLLSQTK